MHTKHHKNFSKHYKLHPRICNTISIFIYLFYLFLHILYIYISLCILVDIFSYIFIYYNPYNIFSCIYSNTTTFFWQLLFFFFFIFVGCVMFFFWSFSANTYILIYLLQLRVKFEFSKSRCSTHIVHTHINIMLICIFVCSFSIPQNIHNCNNDRMLFE